MSSVVPFTGEEDWDCPLCMEEMDLSDKNFKPCPCGYQVCRFCWHKIREDGNQRCPACRKVYDEADVEFTPVPQEEINRMRQKKRAVKEKREAAAQAELDHSPAGVAATTEIVNSRRHLGEFRVVQRNLVYVIGISARIANENILKDSEFFGQFGKVLKIVVNKKNFLSTGTTANPPSASAYVTFARKDDAARAIEYVDGSVFDDRVIRATYGTTKYCSYFLRGLTCQNPGCMYLHEPGEEVSSFTKEQLAAGSHNLHSFIVDKHESANLRQFGTIMAGPANPHQTPSAASKPTAPVPIAVPVPVPARPSVEPSSPVAPEPPGLSRSSSAEGPAPKVPLIDDLCTSSFFDRLSKLVPATDLDDFGIPPRASFFSSMSPPPPLPPSTFSNTFSEGMFIAPGTGAGTNAGGLKPGNQASSMDEVFSRSHSHSMNRSSSANESFSFTNLPIRSPKPVSATPSPPPSAPISADPVGYNPASTAAKPEMPVPAKAIPIESLFPADYKPAVLVSSESVLASRPAIKTDKNLSEFDSAVMAAVRSESPSPSSSIRREPVKFVTIEKKKAVEAQHTTTSASTIPSSAVSASIKPTPSSPTPAIQPASSNPKITIAGRPLDSEKKQTERLGHSTTDPSTPLAGKNLFELLQHAEHSAVNAANHSAPTPLDSSAAALNKVGNIKVVSAYSMPIQTSADLERIAKEGNLNRHIAELEQTMFRSRLDAETVENKLKLLFESSNMAGKRSAGSAGKPQGK